MTNPHKMTPAWSVEHSNAAIAEGWEIFDCDGSSNGRWQVNCLDSPLDWAEEGGVVPPELNGDEAAWKIVANGTQPHHEAARVFLQAHNPQEYALVMKHKV
jgi:hypothetical protein